MNDEVARLTNELKQADKNYLELKNAFDGRIREVFARIEKISRVIDWEEDLGEMRELKEADYQALKKDLGYV